MWQTLKDVYWLSQSCKWYIVIAIIGTFLVQALEIVTPYVLSWLIDLLDTVSLGIDESFWWQGSVLILVLICAQVASRCLDIGTGWFIYKTICAMESGLSQRVYSHLLSLSLGYHEQENTGSTIKKIQRGSDATINLLRQWGWGGVPIIFLLLVSLFALIATSFWVGFALLALVATTITISQKLYRRTHEDREKRHDGYQEVENRIVQGIQNIATVQSYCQEKEESRKIRKKWGDILACGFREFKCAMKMEGIRAFLAVVVSAFVIAYSFYQAATGSLTKGSFLLIIFLMRGILQHLWFLESLMDDTVRESSSVRRLRELLETEPSVQEKEDAIHLSSTDGAIEFRNVSYRYPEAEEDALHGISLDIPAGTVTALVGPSGGGKSTLIKLLLRSDDPREGEVTIDGIDLRDLSFDFRKSIGFVTQEPQIFDLSVAENIAYGNPDLTMEEIREAARMAYVDEFVDKMPNGYDSLVGEKGVRLSGGQKQRLAIARAIAGNCRILVFDEATSHLDSKSERFIQDALAKAAQGRTLIVIAHRLSTIYHADHIVVLRDGRIVERGTHQSLRAKKNGVYGELLQLQVAGDVEGEFL